MANYVPTARTNYFKVRDPEAFTAWVGQYSGVRVVPDDEDESLRALLFEQGLPTQLAEEEDDGHDFLGELAEHLPDGWVAVYEEVGYEKMRYLVGYAMAINNKGETKEISISEIYERAKALGEHISVAEY